MQEQKPKKSSLELDSNEQVAFAKLFNDLVFINSVTDLEFKIGNASKISKAIQNEFLKIKSDVRVEVVERVEQASAAISKALDFALSARSKPENIDNGDSPVSVYEELDQKKAEAIINTVSEVLIMETYYGWGFTPKLAKKLEAYDISLNCLGQAIKLGAVLQAKGEKVFMAVGADHPLVIGYSDDGEVFEYKNFNGKVAQKEILKGEIEDLSGVKVFKLSQKREGDPQTQFYIFNFDDAVLHETLENLKVLREMSMGHPVSNLPNTKIEGMKIADAHKEELQAVDIDKLQQRLYPQIHNFFKENQDMIQKDIEEVHADRVFMLASNLMKKLTGASVKESLAISHPSVEIREDMHLHEADILDRSRKFGTDIVRFLYQDTALPGQVSEDLKAYFATFKSGLEKSGFEDDVLDKIKAILYLSLAKNLLGEDE
jgi:hypothetical protein